MILFFAGNPSSAVIEISPQSLLTATIQRSILQAVNDTEVDVQCTVRDAVGEPSIIIVLNRNNILREDYSGSERCTDHPVTRSFSFVASFTEDHNAELVCSAGAVEHRLIVDVTGTQIFCETYRQFIFHKWNQT